MQDCLFCKIARKEIPSKVVLENDSFIAFLDIRPISEGHTLVIPKKHSKDFLNLTQDEETGFLDFTKQVAQKVVKATKATGFNLGLNNGVSAGQAVFHVHMHVIPRKEDDGLVSWSHKQVTNRELEETIKKINS